MNVIKMLAVLTIAVAVRTSFLTIDVNLHLVKSVLSVSNVDSFQSNSKVRICTCSW